MNDSRKQADPAVTQDNTGRLYLHGMLAGYLEQNGAAVLDESYFGTEINWFLLGRDIPIRWKDGISKALEKEDCSIRASPAQHVRLYQLSPVAPEAMRFAGFRELSSRGYTVSAEHYRLVFDGPCQGDLDDIYEAFNHPCAPIGFTGHHLNVSDVIELSGSEMDGFYFVDRDCYVPLPEFQSREEDNIDWFIR